MTLRDLITDNVSDVFLQTDEFAETCYRLIGGDDSQSRSIIGILTEDMAISQEVRGRDYTHSRTFHFSSDVSLTEDDAIRIGSLRYEIDSISDPILGMKVAKLVRTQRAVKGGKAFRTGDL